MEKMTNKLVLVLCLVIALIPSDSLRLVFTGIALFFVSSLALLKSIKYRNFICLIVFLFIFNYSIVPLDYILGFENHIIKNIHTAESVETVCQTSFCLLLFISVLINSMVFIVPEENNDYLFVDENPYVYWTVFIAAVLCFIFGLSGDNILESGGYGRGMSNRSSLYEYGIIFILIAIIYSKSGFHKNIVYFLCICFILKDLMFGGRVFSLQLLLAIFMLRYLHSISFKMFLLYVFVGYLFFQFWGHFRESLQGSEGYIAKKDGNSAYVFYASMRIHYFIDKGILCLTDRLRSFFYFICSLFVSTDKLPSLANLSIYKQSSYYTGGGGLVSTFVYCWLGYPGVVLIPHFLGKILSGFYYTNSKYFKFYSLLVLINIPRWFAYYPIGIIKFAFIGTLLFYIFDKMFKKQK